MIPIAEVLMVLNSECGTFGFPENTGICVLPLRARKPTFCILFEKTTNSAMAVFPGFSAISEIIDEVEVCQKYPQVDRQRYSHVATFKNLNPNTQRLSVFSIDHDDVAISDVKNPLACKIIHIAHPRDANRASLIIE